MRTVRRNNEIGYESSEYLARIHRRCDESGIRRTMLQRDVPRVQERHVGFQQRLVDQGLCQLWAERDHCLECNIASDEIHFVEIVNDAPIYERCHEDAQGTSSNRVPTSLPLAQVWKRAIQLERFIYLDP